MEKNNNGKIAIAIVAMFVVALSIVGITYAYFTTSVQKNTTEDVKVQAGILSVAYEHGTAINADGIVPGWKNDGKMIYHSQASVTTEEDGTVKITAVDINSLTPEQEEAVNNNQATQTEPEQPLTFTVNNDGTDTAYYGIRLVNVTNDIAGNTKTDDDSVADKDNFIITLKNTDSKVTADLIEETSLVATGYQNISGAITIAKGDTHSFQLDAEYVAELNKVQPNQGADVMASVEIVGLNKLADDSFVAADGDTWTGLAS